MNSSRRFDTISVSLLHNGSRFAGEANGIVRNITSARLNKLPNLPIRSISGNSEVRGAFLHVLKVKVEIVGWQK